MLRAAVDLAGTLPGWKMPAAMNRSWPPKMSAAGRRKDAPQRCEVLIYWAAYRTARGCTRRATWGQVWGQSQRFTANFAGLRRTGARTLVRKCISHRALADCRERLFGSRHVVPPSAPIAGSFADAGAQRLPKRLSLARYRFRTRRHHVRVDGLLVRARFTLMIRVVPRTRPAYRRAQTDCSAQ